MVLAAFSALWLGILTSISPCPLATNIAAISFIAKHLDNAGQILSSGLAYTIGRMLAYVAAGVIIIAGLLSIPALATFLENYLNLLLGPILIIIGMFLLELISFAPAERKNATAAEARVRQGGVLNSAVLGFIFGLSFCPISAALFFGSLIPLSIEHGSRILLPSIYGIGTALPVVVFAFIIAFSAQSISKAFNALKTFENGARIVTGVLFILLGIYYILTRIYQIKFFA